MSEHDDLPEPDPARWEDVELWSDEDDGPEDPREPGDVVPAYDEDDVA